MLRKEELLLRVFLVEFVNPAGGVNQHVFAGKEGMRSIGNLQFDQGIFVAVFPLSGFFAGGRRAAQKAVTVTHVFENHVTVVGRMKILFHKNLFNCGCCCLIEGAKVGKRVLTTKRQRKKFC